MPACHRSGCGAIYVPVPICLPIQLLRLTVELDAFELGDLQLEPVYLQCTDTQALLECRYRLTQLLLDTIMYCQLCVERRH